MTRKSKPAGELQNLTHDELLNLARALLNTQGRPAVVLTDDIRAKALSLAFASGVEIEDTNGEVWTPSAQHMHINDGNFGSAVQAFEAGRLRFTFANMNGLVAAADSDKAAFDALRIIADDCDRRGIPFPESVDRPPSVRPREGDGCYRDHSIQVAVYWLSEFGLYASNNDESCSVSACALVAEVLHMDSRAVRKVWNKRSWKKRSWKKRSWKKHASRA